MKTAFLELTGCRGERYLLEVSSIVHIARYQGYPYEDFDGIQTQIDFNIGQASCAEYAKESLDEIRSMIAALA